MLDRQVEQDLVISRALFELLSSADRRDPRVRGGTALYKFHITPAARYSEDIDLVQTHVCGVVEALDAIHDALDPWLSNPKWKQTEGRVTLSYRFDSEDVPPAGLVSPSLCASRGHFVMTSACGKRRYMSLHASIDLSRASHVRARRREGTRRSCRAGREALVRTTLTESRGS